MKLISAFSSRELRVEFPLSILAIYVDDMILATNCPTWKRETLSKFEDDFKMKINENPTCFLGVEFIRDHSNQTIFLQQRSYVEKLLQKFRMDSTNPQYTPMETRLNIQETEIKNESSELRSIIGALLFVSRNTRPDISFLVSDLSRFQTEAHPEIFDYAKRYLSTYWARSTTI